MINFNNYIVFINLIKKKLNKKLNNNNKIEIYNQYFILNNFDLFF